MKGIYKQNKRMYKEREQNALKMQNITLRIIK